MDEKDLEFLKKLATLKENGVIDDDELQRRKNEYFKTKEEQQIQKENVIKQFEEKNKLEEERRRQEEERRKQFISKNNNYISAYSIAVGRERRRQFISEHKGLVAGGTVLGTVIGLALLILIIHSLVMSNRTIYSSENEMRDALQGTWTYSDSIADIEKQIIIDEDEAEITYDGYGPYVERITWNPSKGTFETFNKKFIVTNNGTIKEGGDVYSNEEDWYYDDGYNYDYEW